MSDTAILFCCLGNICRSPMAEGVFRQLLDKHGLASTIRVDSAGTDPSWPGHAPDSNAQIVMRERGLDISHLRARRIVAGDFEHFDHIVAMDVHNCRSLLNRCPENRRSRISRLLNHADGLSALDVPDPYGQDLAVFRDARELIERGCTGLLCAILRPP